MSEVLDKVREKYPDAYANIDDDELALRIGAKFPAYLDRDPEFKKEFQTVVGTRAVTAAQMGTTTLINVLSSPAAGEASEMAREQSKEAAYKETQPTLKEYKPTFIEKLRIAMPSIFGHPGEPGPDEAAQGAIPVLGQILL